MFYKTRQDIMPNYKIHIENTGDESIIIDWASGMNTPSNCFGNSKGQKLDSSMGWLMGFRSRLIEISPKNNIISSGLIDLEGPKYFLLILDDFVNNKPNQDLITMIGAEKDTSFKLPSYWNKQMGDHWRVSALVTKIKNNEDKYLEDLLENWKPKTYKLPRVKLSSRGEKVCGIMSIQDIHFGKEGNQTIDKDFEDTIVNLVNRATPSHYMEKLYFVVGGVS